MVAEKSGQENCTRIKESDKGTMRKRTEGNNCKSWWTIRQKYVHVI